MNYIEQINGFWNKSEESDLTGLDIAVYMSLLKYCNRLNWLNPFICHWDIVCQTSKVSKNAYYKSLERLNDLGFIKSEKGVKNTTQKPKILILDLTNNKGTVREQRGNKEGIEEEQQGNLYKHLNNLTDKQINIILNFYDSLSDYDLQLKIEEINSEENKTLPAKAENIDFNSLLKYLNNKTGRSFRTVNDTVKKKYKATLKQGYTKEDIRTAIDNAVKAKNHIDSNFQYLTMEFFSRPDKLDMYSAKKESGRREDETPEEKELRERIEFAKSVKIH